MKKKILIFCAALAAGAAYAESPLPMPTVSVPTLGGGFYAPGSADFYGPSSPAAPARPSRVTPEAAAKAQDTPARSAADASRAETPVSRKLMDVQAHTADILTAGDISSLGNLGYFRNLSGLLGLSRSQSLNSGAVDLDAVLSELNDLKSRVEEKDRNPDVLRASFENQSRAVSRILRFSVNGYDMNKTMQTVYFSNEEPDGTFLLTGDRLYYADGADRAETFYILFKTFANDDGITKYRVSASVSQDYENPNSFLAKLSALSLSEELTADRTGNFVTMKHDGDGLKMDVLLGLER